MAHLPSACWTQRQAPEILFSVSGAATCILCSYSGTPSWFGHSSGSDGHNRTTVSLDSCVRARHVPALACSSRIPRCRHRPIRGPSWATCSYRSGGVGCAGCEGSGLRFQAVNPCSFATRMHWTPRPMPGFGPRAMSSFVCSQGLRRPTRAVCMPQHSVKGTVLDSLPAELRPLRAASSCCSLLLRPLASLHPSAPSLVPMPKMCAGI